MKLHLNQLSCNLFSNTNKTRFKLQMWWGIQWRKYVMIHNCFMCFSVTKSLLHWQNKCDMIILADSLLTVYCWTDYNIIGIIIHHTATCWCRRNISIWRIHGLRKGKKNICSLIGVEIYIKNTILVSDHHNITETSLALPTNHCYIITVSICDKS